MEGRKILVSSYFFALHFFAFHSLAALKISLRRSVEILGFFGSYRQIFIRGHPRNPWHPWSRYAGRCELTVLTTDHPDDADGADGIDTAFAIFLPLWANRRSRQLGLVRQQTSLLPRIYKQAIGGCRDFRP